ncbi:mechanosensitive ion channel family protein [Adhaeribacter aquaticus]|uniref:mechanosensitive ion channel family protein n=1 Tax=Adhaeribacter aquaticus TaxID=299567 RepID=UPI0004047423|nr:mechanosensitive ion channel domain-containing protein [Adhaeribacter aquaticus]
MFDFEKYRETITQLFLIYGARLVVALVILFIGLWLISKIIKFLDYEMQSRQVDASLRPFLRSLLNISLKILLLILVISQLGMEMTSFFAVLGSAGLAVGLALQGSLSNFAGGILILAVKPFRVGDYIEAQNVGGTVAEINILHTIIKTTENKTIFIPNGPLAASTIVNYDVEETRRTDIRIQIKYDNDIDAAKALITNLLLADQRIITNPAPQVLTENTPAGVILITRVWADKQHIGSLTNDLHDIIRSTLQKQNFNI